MPQESPAKAARMDWKETVHLFELEATGFSEERFGSESDERFDAFGDEPKFVCGVDGIATQCQG